MQGYGLEIVQFDPHSATEEEFRRLNSYYNKVRTETWPDEPPLTLAQTIRDETERPEFLEVKEWRLSTSFGSFASLARWYVQEYLSAYGRFIPFAALSRL